MHSLETEFMLTHTIELERLMDICTRNAVKYRKPLVSTVQHTTQHSKYIFIYVISNNIVYINQFIHYNSTYFDRLRDISALNGYLFCTLFIWRHYGKHSNFARGYVAFKPKLRRS